MVFADEAEAKPADDAAVAALVTSLIHARRFPLPDALLRVSSLFPQVAWAEYAVFAGARARALALGLLDVHDDESFTRTELASELAGETHGRFFHEIASVVAAWLEAASVADTSDVPVLTEARFDAAIKMAADKREARRLRIGLTGAKKWSEWDDAPPLDFASCVEFLTFIAGRRVNIRVGCLDVTGRLQPPNPAPARPSVLLWRVGEPSQSVRFPDSNSVILALDPAAFKTASFSSVDDIDHFTLAMVFDDNDVYVSEP